MDVTPADPFSRLSLDFKGDTGLAVEEVHRHIWSLWDRLCRRTIFLWTVGLPFGPFVMLRSWHTKLRSLHSPLGMGFHDIFLEFHV